MYVCIPVVELNLNDSELQWAFKIRWSREKKFWGF